MPEYLLLLHEQPSDFAGFSPEEFEMIIGEYIAWRHKLEAEGKFAGGQKLQDEGPLPVADLAASFQRTVARSLTKRAIACAQDFGHSTIAVGGGVKANSGLRQHLQEAAAARGIRG